MTPTARPIKIFDVWDVVKVPFPYTNRPVLQRRPALVVSCYAASGAPSLLWVLMITSALHRRWEGDIEIDALAEAGLPNGSIVRCAKIATIEAGDAAVIGRLSLTDQVRVRSTFFQALAAAVQA